MCHSKSPNDRYRSTLHFCDGRFNVRLPPNRGSFRHFGRGLRRDTSRRSMWHRRPYPSEDEHFQGSLPSCIAQPLTYGARESLRRSKRRINLHSIGNVCYAEHAANFPSLGVGLKLPARCQPAGETDVINSLGRFAWYELITTEAEAAKAFYSKVMGWGMLDASVASRAYTLFTAGNDLVSGLTNLPEEEQRIGGKPAWIGYIAVDDVDETAGRIANLGGTVHVPPTDVINVSRFSIFADPQTARLGLLRWSRPPSLQKPAGLGTIGQVGWHELLATDWQTAFAFYSELFGWQQADADLGEMGTYQLFSSGGQAIGGMVTRAPVVSAPFWLYYFDVGDVDAAARRVETAGGQIFNGPVQLPGGNKIVQCSDPQGVIFALRGRRAHESVGYFKGPAGQQWSW